MANQHLDASEIVAGLCLDGMLSPTHVPLTALYPPYDSIISMLLDGKDEASVVAKVGILPVQAAKSAAMAVSDKPALEWVDILVQASQREEMATLFEKEAKRLRAGNDPDVAKVSGLMEHYNVREGRYTTMDQISDEEITWVKTYYEPIDRHFGSFTNKDNCGIPEAQVVVIGAPPGCLTGDTEVTINRAGKSFRITMEKLEFMFNGGKASGRIWDKQIPTTSRSMYEDGTIRLNLVENVMYSGDKECFTLTTQEGRTLSGTEDHPIYTPDGKVWLSKLKPGDLIYVDGGQKKSGRHTKSNYLSKEGLKFHPYAGRRESNRWSVPLHRLVLEAAMNSMSVDKLIDCCRSGETTGIIFLSPELAVHHRDEDTYNNDISNLQILTHKEHKKLHAKVGWKNVCYTVTTEVVKSVEPIGIRKTYDISMRDDPHNFIANGIVVSNTGKTTLMVKLMALQAMHGKKVLMYELEMTRQQVTRRTIEVASIVPQYRKNIYVCDEILSPAEIFVEASRMVSADPAISMIAIDYMSLAVEEEDEPTITRAYKLMQRLAKNTRRPVIILSQLSGQYTGNVPMLNHLRYSRMIEALAGMVFLLYNPNQVFSSMGKDSRIPIIDGRAYIIAGKSKFGYREGGTGAIQVEFDPAKGWGDESLGWFPLNIG